MIDIKLVRENPELVKENLKKKFQGEKLYLIDIIRKKDIDWRNQKQRVDKLRNERNIISKEIANYKKQGKEVKKLMHAAKLIPNKIEEIEKKVNKLKEQIDETLKKLPNIIHKSVPIGKDGTENVEIKKIGKPKKFNFKLKNHVELAESLGIADFDTSAKTSGNGFYYLKGDLALLNQALISFSRELMLSKKYDYIEPPLMIRENILRGVYSTEEINQMSYKIQDEDLYLIATSEHPLIGMFINKTLRKEELPIKLTGYSMCFRKEIGSHGINEKGLFRTHQFNKQEMVVICKPEDSYKFYDEILNISVEFYKKLGIPTRILESCSGDLADLKAKGADLEYWSLLDQEYKEIGSVTNMEEAQARRLNIKYVDEKNERRFPHTLNNTVIATSRALVAILENYQQKDGTVEIPKVLQPYMQGKKVIKKN
ncbi:MAG: serine--tRNA ligase [Nanoarchaeota archaeon]|nr:serine--tRNA ligase [Nanoarchaeota archaeon]MBU1052105.1 serine--tRNA ligase [Nanoarchaeota archaeon]